MNKMNRFRDKLDLEFTRVTVVLKRDIDKRRNKFYLLMLMFYRLFLIILRVRLYFYQNIKILITRAFIVLRGVFWIISLLFLKLFGIRLIIFVFFGVLLFIFSYVFYGFLFSKYEESYFDLMTFFENRIGKINDQQNRYYFTVKAIKEGKCEILWRIEKEYMSLERFIKIIKFWKK